MSYFLKNLVVCHEQLIRYFLAGGVVVLVNLSFLYLFTDIFGIYYIISTIYSFLISFVVSFFLQKIWTFGDKDISKVRATKQMMLYLCLQGSCIILNAVLMYVFVEYIHLWYIISQIVISIIIAFCAFLFSRRFIFKPSLN
ncbi:MAG: hypothetical protein RL536_628 [Candidatus Parcubacteria bacterium]